MTKRLLFVCGLSLMLLSSITARAGAQTVAAGPYYATPSWDQKLACSTPANCPRFIVLSNWNNEAVLDRETGLVWERSPAVFPFENAQSLPNAHHGCFQKQVGGRKGWRLPSVEELNSLIDPSASTVALPPGHPFIGVKTGFFDAYWSVTRMPTTSFGYLVSFEPGLTKGVVPLSTPNFYWCVRGPDGAIQ